jgi:hypothetical protein
MPAPVPVVAIMSDAPRGNPGGLFRGKWRMEEESEDLRRQLTALLGLDPSAVTAEAARPQGRVQQLRAEQTAMGAQLTALGTFGPGMVKIGVRRRRATEDRVRELSDASVPLRFDTHALIFSRESVGVKTQLHVGLADQRVNKVNTRREFFQASSEQVRRPVQADRQETSTGYHETPEALERRAGDAHNQQHKRTLAASASRRLK